MKSPPIDPFSSIVKSRRVDNKDRDGILAILKPYLSDATDFSQYKNEPVKFAEEILGVTFWPRQREIVESVWNNRNTVVEKGHSIGGSYAVATLVLSWMVIKHPAKCVTTAPVFNQVQNQIWLYMRTLAGRAKKSLPGTILEGQPLWKLGEDSLAIGLSPRKASEKDVAALQGYHSPNLLVILDEAAGLTHPLFNAAKSLCTGEANRLLCIGNPTAKEGPFYDATQDSAFKHLRISSLEHPNVIEDREIFPGAVSRSWVMEQIKTNCLPCDEGLLGAFQFLGHWYMPNPIFAARVLGRPPDEKESQLIRLAWVQAAQNNESIAKTGEMRVLGMDVALMGEDDSVILFRVGDVVQWMRRIHGQDTNELLMSLTNAYEVTGAHHIFVDSTSIGAGLCDVAQAAGLPVEGINAQSRARQKTRFANTRAETWWIVREKLRKGELALYNVSQESLLESDLVSPNYESDQYGRIQLEDKLAMKKRLGRSPDAGDALALSYAGYIPELDDAADLGGVDLSTGESRWQGEGQTSSRWIVSGKKRKWSWGR